MACMAGGVNIAMTEVDPDVASALSVVSICFSCVQIIVSLLVSVAVFVIWAHRSNIGRLMRGEENRFGRRGVKQAEPAPGEAQS